MLSPGMPLIKNPRIGWLPIAHSRMGSLRTVLFCLCWFLILLAAAYDAYFAWQYRMVLEAWEINPFILWLASVGGMASVLAVKLLSMVFSTGVAMICHVRRHRLELPLTLIVGSAYFALSFHYFVSFLRS